VPAPAAPASRPSPGAPELAAIVPAAQLPEALADSLADTVSVKAVLRQLDDRVANLTDQLVRTEADDAVARARLQRCAGWTRDSLVDGRVLPVESAGLGALRQELVERQMELASARQVYGAMHPRMRALQSEMAVLQASVDRELQRAVAETRAEHEALATRAAALRGDLGRTEQALAVYERRLPDPAPAAPDPLPPPVEIVDSATLAPQPIRPHRLLNLAACLAAGGLMGCGLATYRYSGRRTIDTPEDVEEELQLPVLGIVPRNA
ncbi:MAG TPA: hypothetical protein VI504_11090, partial [Candidatus Eisenbacteria bacterium]|jgi:uncharacterized protein involved in exopolysaccharide biosynthesis